MDTRREIKTDTQLVIIAVLILTIITMGVSYASFFSIKSESSIQEVEAGTLKVVIDGREMDTEELFPTPEEDLPTSVNAVTRGKYAKLNLTNEGTLDADYSVTIGYDSLPDGKSQSDLLSFNWLIIGIYDEEENKWLQYGNGYYTPITSITPSDTNVYPIMRSIIPASSDGTPSTKQYRIYIWLSENTPVSEIGKLVFLKLDIKSTTVGGHPGGGA